MAQSREPSLWRSLRHRLRPRARRFARQLVRKVPVPLPLLLDALEPVSAVVPVRGQRRWATLGKEGFGLSGDDFARWWRRAWWGSQASLLVGARVAEHGVGALDAILDPVDWSPVDALYAEGRGLVCVSAHLGPRIMVALLQQRLPTLRSMGWDDPNGESRVPFMTLSDDATRRQALVMSRAHLRSGGALYVVIDAPVGGRQVALPMLGGLLGMQSGVATLARLAGAPALPAFVAWRGHRLTLRFGDPIRPQAEDREEWEKQWMRAYARWLEGALRAGPENMRWREGMRLRDLGWAARFGTPDWS